MDNVRNLDERMQRHLDDYLQSVSQVLARSGMDRSQIQSVLEDIEIQAIEMLRDRAGDSPTEADMRATIAGLADPESFAQATEATSGDRLVPDEALTPRRISRLAILGICWAPFFFILKNIFQFIDFLIPGSTPTEPALLPVLLFWTFLTLGLTAPFATTILGWVAVSQIENSAGRLSGLGLAVAGGLLYPLLFLDVITFGLTLLLSRGVFSFFWWSWPQTMSRHHDLVSLFLTLITVGVILWIDYAVIKWVWKRVGSGP